MNSFENLAPHYDQHVADRRFDYEKAVSMILPWVSGEPQRILDLASGTGNMAQALHRRWPQASIVCEEPSSKMLDLLRQKCPYADSRQRSLQGLAIDLDQVPYDLVTIAFNSVNYVAPEFIAHVLKILRNTMHAGAVLYFDSLLREEADKLLNGRSSMEKSVTESGLLIVKRLTSSCLYHKFSQDGWIEEHSQYLLSTDDYLKFLYQAGFRVVESSQETGTLRGYFVGMAV